MKYGKADAEAMFSPTGMLLCNRVAAGSVTH